MQIIYQQCKSIELKIEKKEKTIENDVKPRFAHKKNLIKFKNVEMKKKRKLKLTQ